MFYHNFKYSLKTLVKNKALIFWTFAFPLILGTLFNLAFSDLENNEKLTIIDIAIVDNEDFKNNIIFKNTFTKLSDKKNENQLFNTKYVALEEAKTLLEDSKITGYLLFDENKVEVNVLTTGINETILRFVVDEITTEKSLIETVAAKSIMTLDKNAKELDYEKIYAEAISIVSNTSPSLKNITNANISYTMIEFYTLIAMACLYGAILSIVATNKNLANMSSAGKRISISKTPKKTTLLSSLLASYIVQLVGVTILFLYTIFVLNVDYGTNLGLIILLALVASFAGLSLGVAIATLLKTNENTKTGILIAITMTCCFLSGMMGITMKYLVDKNVPILNLINPASMITDGFYALYYYSSLNRYYFDVISLIIFSLILLLISYRGLRRQKYDSI